MLNALSPPLAARTIRCDIFCVVVDNYGDAGVCWRLARQLAEEYGWQVRLWIDNPAPLDRLAPDHFQSPVAVAPWPCDMSPDESADVVIEAFACELPTTYIAAMAQREKKPVWLNLDYLSAEDWVGEMHGLPSPHPRLPLVKHFFFPGFDERSGGLLREADYNDRRVAFDAGMFRTELGLPGKAPHELTISLFSYPAAPVAQLMQALARSEHPILLLLPGSDAASVTQGALTVHPLPFLPQVRYDELLWMCDLNFVRGEDSFVRAQWAGKPFVWQIYPQTDDVHRVKLDAFLTRYLQKVGADDTAIDAISTFWHAWNSEGVLTWPAFAAALPALAPATQRWSTALARQTNLASNLVQFCLDRLK
ncbi:MAG TPA: elongation factor P maturation arginine rhamnosyltransferase EarP [Rugosibacter sp.]